ncbi:hypothetical protein DERF_015930 [Dermatophagoides farinae]|uniref:Uncharacterized protein n=1 Tax=Dermatophagoides farinae TaxID=6954 RepID=A0A922KT76_DERFA|nr:hypothetical protein DERF_015930 [Dermatophagoides farinae]
MCLSRNDSDGWGQYYRPYAFDDGDAEAFSNSSIVDDVLMGLASAVSALVSPSAERPNVY